MRWRSSCVLWLAGALWALPASAMQAVGVAHAPDGGAVRYREYHNCDSAKTHCTVEYRDPSGAVFARKWLDYGASPVAPSLRFEDSRSGERLQLGSDEVKTGVVVDAGFDNFVREQWALLAAGDAVHFRFLPAGSETALAMEARRQDDCSDGRLCLAVKPDNWLFALVGGTIHLVYDRDSRRLLQFRGLSNILDARGDSQRLVIDYHYPGVGN